MGGCVSPKSKGDGPVPIQKCMAGTGEGGVGTREVGALGSQRELLGQSVPEHPRRLVLSRWGEVSAAGGWNLTGELPKGNPTGTVVN